MNLVRHFVSILLGTFGIAAGSFDMHMSVMTALALHKPKLINIRCNYPRLLKVLAVGLGGRAT